MTLDLPAFLTARWDEEEQAARAAAEPWESDSEGGWFAGLHEETIEHTARHNPDRVLADLDAKRKILADGPTPCVNGRDEDGHYDGTGDVDPHLTGMTCRECVWAAAETTQWEHTVRLLALPHAAHPD